MIILWFIQAAHRKMKLCLSDHLIRTHFKDNEVAKLQVLRDSEISKQRDQQRQRIFIDIIDIFKSDFWLKYMMNNFGKLQSISLQKTAMKVQKTLTKMTLVSLSTLIHSSHSLKPFVTRSSVLTNLICGFQEPVNSFYTRKLQKYIPPQTILQYSLNGPLF